MIGFMCCPRCGRLNRLRDRHKGATCGQCKTSLTAGSCAVDDERLGQLIRKSPIPLLVDFWAPWCQPCQWMAPHLEVLAERYVGDLIIVKILVEESPQHAAAYQIRSVPTCLLLDRGVVRHRIEGGQTVDMLERIVRPYLTSRRLRSDPP